MRHRVFLPLPGANPSPGLRGMGSFFISGVRCLQLICCGSKFQIVLITHHRRFHQPQKIKQRDNFLPGFKPVFQIK